MSYMKQLESIAAIPNQEPSPVEWPDCPQTPAHSLHVYMAINEVTGKLAKSGISKDRKNDQQGYKFRGIDDVYNALSALIAESRLCVLPRVGARTVTERTTKSGGVLFYVVVDVDYDLISAVDGSRHTVHVIGEAMDSGDKATNKAMSAAYKYMAMQVFCIPTEGDNDADAQTHQVQPMRHSPADGIDTSAVDIDQMHDYADRIKALLDGNDVPHAIELWRELSRAEQVVLWKIQQPHGLNMKQKDAIRQGEKTP